MEAVDGLLHDGPTEGFECRAQLVGQGRLACGINAVDGDPDGVREADVGQTRGQSIEQTQTARDRTI